MMAVCIVIRVTVCMPRAVVVVVELVVVVVVELVVVVVVELVVVYRPSAHWCGRRCGRISMAVFAHRMGATLGVGGARAAGGGDKDAFERGHPHGHVRTVGRVRESARTRVVVK